MASKRKKDVRKDAAEAVDAQLTHMHLLRQREEFYVHLAIGGEKKRVGALYLFADLFSQASRLAWVYSQYCKRPICDKWRQLEAEAWVRRRGLWGEPYPVPPWEFRREQGR
jgi:hypothetical protein